MTPLEELLDIDTFWQMSLAEKSAILYLLTRLTNKEVAVEVGSFRGGLLRVLSKSFETVYSIDIDHSQLEEQHSNVVYLEGDSKEILPELVSNLNRVHQEVSFIIIDGDHERPTIDIDIRNILEYQPPGETILLFHDSWYEPVRDALNEANWDSSPYVQYVEKDFSLGELVGTPTLASAEGFFLAGGLAIVGLSSRRRRGRVEVEQSHDYTYLMYKQMLDKNRDYLQLHHILKKLTV